MEDIGNAFSGGESKVESVIEEEKTPEVVVDMNSPLVPPAPSPKLFPVPSVTHPSESSL